MLLRWRGCFGHSPTFTSPTILYPIQFGDGDWTTGVCKATGMFSGELVLPNGNAVSDTASLSNSTSPPPPGGRELLVQEYVFWDSALMAHQIGIA